MATCAPCLTEVRGLLQSPVTVHAETSDVIVMGTCGKNATWNYNRTTNVMTISGTGFASYNNGISRYRKERKKLVFSDTITGIGIAAFQDCTALEDIQFGGVKAIRRFAFEGCTALKSLDLDGNIKRIGAEAFRDCTNLTTVTVGSKVKTVKLGKNVNTIGSYAFAGCSKLSKMNAWTNLTKIGSYSFHGCKALKTFSIGKSVKSIGEGAFSECTSLRKLSVHKNNPYFSKRDNMLLNKRQSKIVSACFGSNKTCNIYYSRQ